MLNHCDLTVMPHSEIFRWTLCEYGVSSHLHWEAEAPKKVLRGTFCPKSAEVIKQPYNCLHARDLSWICIKSYLIVALSSSIRQPTKTINLAELTSSVLSISGNPCKFAASTRD